MMQGGRPGVRGIDRLIDRLLGRLTSWRLGSRERRGKNEEGQLDNQGRTEGW